ncbi:MAG: DMT family transporter [Hyphomicrobiaceae bacterium]|nr:DMT family transporter [Hyphomicrobiaceae bacterium]
MRTLLRHPAAAYVLLLIPAAAWAGNHVVARAAASQVPPASLAVVRWSLLAALIGMLTTEQIQADWRRMRAHAGVLLFLGVVGAGVFGTLQFVALKYTTALNMGVVGSVSPAFIVLASFLLFGDRLGAVQLAGVGVSFLGVLAIVARLDPQMLARLTFNSGDLIIIGNMSLWAIYSACVRMRPAIAPMSFMFAISVVALAVNVPFGIWELASGLHLKPTPITVVAILYSALVTTLLAYVCWNKGIELVGAPRASAFLHTVPVFSALLATTILGERLELYHLVGFALILAGVTLAARPRAGAIAEGEAVK